MTEDELLEQIRKTDPDAHIIEYNNVRLLVTSALQSSTMLYVNPANMRIVHMDPLELELTAPAFGKVDMYKALASLGLEAHHREPVEPPDRSEEWEHFWDG